MFHDREDAGRQLAVKLKRFGGRQDVVVVALPRGGVVLGRIVADALGAPLDLVVPRKIGSPGDEEYAIGAITEEGDAVWNEAERSRTDAGYLQKKIAEQQAEARRRLDLYRRGLPPRRLRDRTVIVVDDGIATGLTMRAALKTIRAAGPQQIVLAVPVAPPDSLDELAAEADETVALETPRLFGAIGAFYQEFDQVEDATVIKLMRPGRREL